MAFLCPSRLGAKKKRRGYQSMVRRLTCDGNVDSLRVDDLVKLSYYAPEARRIVLQTFNACAQHELSVKQGQKVNFVYSDGDWAYVATDDKKQGFIPLNVCAKIGIQNDLKTKNCVSKFNVNVQKESVPDRKISMESVDSESSCSDGGTYDSFTEWSNDSDANDTSDTTVQVRGVSGMTVQNGQPVAYVRSVPYDRSPIVFDALDSQHTHQVKNDVQCVPSVPAEDFDNPPSPTGIYRVLYDYKGTDVYDVTVRADDIVFLLDTRDRDWFWVQLPNGHQGYIPSNYMGPIESYEQTSKDKQDGMPYHQIQTQSHEVSKTSKDVCRDQVAKITCAKIEENFDQQKSRKDVTNVMNGCVYSQVSKGKEHPISDKQVLTHVKVKDETKFDSAAEDNFKTGKKKAPVKPPRTKRPNNGLSPRSVESLDTTSESVDTSVFESDISVIDSRIDKGVPRSHANTSNSSNPKSSTYGIHEDSRRLGNNCTAHDKHTQRGVAKGDKAGSKRRQSKESKCGHKQSDKQRPLSSPVYKSLEEYRKGYFDEIFYEDRDTKFSQNAERNIVNVTEILKLRARKQRDAERKARELKTNKYDNERPNGCSRGVPTVKQYLIDLPSSKIEQVKQNGTRTYNSGIDPRDQCQGKTSNRGVPMKPDSGGDKDKTVVHEERKYKDVKCYQTKNTAHYGSTTDLRNQNENQNISFRRRCNSHGSDYDKHKIKQTCNPSHTQVKASDWSFGYPRKTKQSHTEVNIPMSNKACYEQNQAMLEILQYTEDLLGTCGKLLDSDSEEYDSDVFESGDNEESMATDGQESEVDVNDKCSSFVHNSTIGISGMGIRAEGIESQNKSDIPEKDKGDSNDKVESCDWKTVPDIVITGPYESIKWVKPEVGVCNNSVSLFDVRGITEFVAQGDYEPEADNELPLKHSEVVHVGLDGQDNEHCYWAYSPRLKKYGFVPRPCVKIPVVTII